MLYYELPYSIYDVDIFIWIASYTLYIFIIYDILFNKIGEYPYTSQENASFYYWRVNFIEYYLTIISPRNAIFYWIYFSIALTSSLNFLYETFIQLFR